MVADRVGHILRVPLAMGEIAANDTLELRKLADQAGHQIRFAQARRGPRRMRQLVFRHVFGWAYDSFIA